MGIRIFVACKAVRCIAPQKTDCHATSWLAMTEEQRCGRAGLTPAVKPFLGSMLMAEHLPGESPPLWGGCQPNRLTGEGFLFRPRVNCGMPGIGRHYIGKFAALCSTPPYGYLWGIINPPPPAAEPPLHKGAFCATITPTKERGNDGENSVCMSRQDFQEFLKTLVSLRKFAFLNYIYQRFTNETGEPNLQ